LATPKTRNFLPLSCRKLSLIRRSLLLVLADPFTYRPAPI
jgi:hypothetical protein